MACPVTIHEVYQGFKQHNMFYLDKKMTTIPMNGMKMLLKSRKWIASSNDHIRELIALKILVYN
jgi:hypothetical protein